MYFRENMSLGCHSTSPTPWKMMSEMTFPTRPRVMERLWRENTGHCCRTDVSRLSSTPLTGRTDTMLRSLTKERLSTQTHQGPLPVPHPHPVNNKRPETLTWATRTLTPKDWPLPVHHQLDRPNHHEPNLHAQPPAHLHHHHVHKPVLPHLHHHHVPPHLHHLVSMELPPSHSALGTIPSSDTAGSRYMKYKF